MTGTLSAYRFGSHSGGAVKHKSNCRQYQQKQRLVKGGQFDRVFKRNKRSRDQHFIVLARHNHLTYARLGLAISRKASGDAVPRNRLKRLVRESFRNRQSDIPGLDCVVMARPGAAKHSGQVLLKSLSKHWDRVARECEVSS